MSASLDAVIRHAVLVRAAPEVVYDVLTTAHGLDSWFTTGAEVDARPGGCILFRWHEWGPDRITAQDGGAVLEADRPARFVFQWHPDRPDYATTVEIDLEPQENDTIVRICESGYQDTPGGRQALADCTAGWGEALTLLKFYIEHQLHY